MTRSVRKTLLVWLLLPLLSILSIGTFTAYLLALSYSEDSHDRTLLESANDMEQLARLSLSESGEIKLPAYVNDILLEDQYDKAFFSILNEQGVLVAGDGKLEMPPTNTSTENHTVFYDTALGSEKVRAVIKHMHFDLAGEMHTWHILVGETLNKRKILSKEILIGFVAPQLVIIILSAVLVMFAIRKGLAPLEPLRAAVARCTHTVLQPLDAHEAPSEIQPFIHEINFLIGRQQNALLAQQRFTADAAHQLRTPLAGLAAQTDLAIAQKNSLQTRHALDQIKKVSCNLNHLVKQLLSLARNEFGTEKSLHLEVVDLVAIARDATIEWISTANGRGIDLGFSGSGLKVEVNGDKMRIREMLDNLIDNALRYCPSGSHVTVSVNQNCTLCVEDNGPGIPPEERDRIFERFHRLPDSEIEGSGLGLAIVKEIAEMHGGNVQVADGAVGRGASFQVFFPETTATRESLITY
jgi:two-component system, OmpR family, sensor histidine kinase TctE